MTGPSAQQWGSTAATVGGLCYIVKGGVILATGDQPPFLFEIAPVFLAAALRALYVLLREVGRGGSVGGPLTIVVLVLSALASIGGVVGDGESTAAGVTLGLGSLGLVIGLIVLGRPARRMPELAAGWRTVPWVLGVSTIPLVMVGGALEEINERLLEIPLVIIGVGWLAYAVLLARWTTQAEVVSSPRAAPTV